MLEIYKNPFAVFLQDISINTAYAFALWAGLTTLNSQLISRIDYFCNYNKIGSQNSPFNISSNPIITHRNNLTGSKSPIFIISLLLSICTLLFNFSFGSLSYDMAKAISSLFIALITLMVSISYMISNSDVLKAIEAVKNQIPKVITILTKDSLLPLNKGELLLLGIAEKEIPRSKKIGDIVVDMGATKPEDLYDILEKQDIIKLNNRMGKLLIKHKGVSRETIYRAMNIQEQQR